MRAPSKWLPPEPVVAPERLDLEPQFVEPVLVQAAPESASGPGRFREAAKILAFEQSGSPRQPESAQPAQPSGHRGSQIAYFSMTWALSLDERPMNSIKIVRGGPPPVNRRNRTRRLLSAPVGKVTEETAFRPQTSRPQTSDLRPQTSDLKLDDQSSCRGCRRPGAKDFGPNVQIRGPKSKLRSLTPTSHVMRASGTTVGTLQGSRGSLYAGFAWIEPPETGSSHRITGGLSPLWHTSLMSHVMSHAITDSDAFGIVASSNAAREATYGQPLLDPSIGKRSHQLNSWLLQSVPCGRDRSPVQGRRSEVGSPTSIFLHPPVIRPPVLDRLLDVGPGELLV